MLIRLDKTSFGIMPDLEQFAYLCSKNTNVLINLKGKNQKACDKNKNIMSGWICQLFSAWRLKLMARIVCPDIE